MAVSTGNMQGVKWIARTLCLSLNFRHDRFLLCMKNKWKWPVKNRARAIKFQAVRLIRCQGVRHMKHTQEGGGGEGLLSLQQNASGYKSFSVLYACSYAAIVRMPQLFIQWSDWNLTNRTDGYGLERGRRDGVTSVVFVCPVLLSSLVLMLCPSIFRESALNICAISVVQ